MTILLKPAALLKQILPNQTIVGTTLSWVKLFETTPFLMNMPAKKILSYKLIDT